MRPFFAAVMFGAMVLRLTTVAQAQSSSENFTGIWQTVDNGILVTVDISDIDGDGQFRYGVNFDFSPACNEAGELGHQLVAPLGPATVNADGDLVLNVMVT